ncbi:hypothetical protein [Planktothrix sp. FACHB-1365]|uniref:hypothetical protein n=1 Tax=Planktothrix sp. FACHB-1365 TaxID=2692855 RepID=UPI0016872F00|nr:hypothetical protein [Planktothrix sp. FACHB-1365]MBD2480486.1 hypothetical protein [Planktothrix sp. FACHB-1365]
MTSVLLYQIAPAPEIPIISEKFRKFEEHKNDYNTLFFGSSRIYRHIIPRVFDRQMASKGYNIKSYNLGVSGMNFAETYFFIQKILETKPLKVKWVFIESPDFDLNIADENLKTDRVIYWHTMEHTLWIYQFILESDVTLTRKLFLLGEHTIPLIYHIFNISQADPLIRSFIFSQPDQNPYLIRERDRRDYSSPGEDGYLALDDEDPTYTQFTQRNQDYLSNLESYQEKVLKLIENQKNSNHRTFLKPLELRTIKEITQLIIKMDAQPILILNPILSNQSQLVIASKGGQIFPLISFNDPIKYPELYDPKNRFDSDHLNKAGSQKFTKLLADQFATYLNSKNINP